VTPIRESKELDWEGKHMTTVRKFVIKIDPDTHRRLKIEAARLQRPLTEYANEVLKRGMTQRKPKNEAQTS
jgi:predicted HicB family RNase H-like nuclease